MTDANTLSNKAAEAAHAVQTTFSQNLGGVAHNAAPGSAKFSLDDVPDQTGKVALITGGSDGIGYGCVHTLLRKNISKVFILSRTEKLIADSVQAIKEELGEEMGNRMVWKQLDLAEWKKIPDVAKEVVGETDRLDIRHPKCRQGYHDL